MRFAKTLNTDEDNTLQKQTTTNQTTSNQKPTSIDKK